MKLSNVFFEENQKEGYLEDDLNMRGRSFYA